MGSVADRYRYDGYGGSAYSSGSDVNPFQYGGGVGYYTESATKLVLATHRWYSADLNRWLSRDPIGASGGENFYSYVEQNPISAVDSLGTQSETHRPKSVVDKIKDAVREDPEAVANINDPEYAHSVQGAIFGPMFGVGSLRNTGLQISSGLGKSAFNKPLDEGGAREFICSGIAWQSSVAINNAVKAGKLPRGTIANPQWYDNGHYTTMVYIPGYGYIELDYHRNLDVDNPVVVGDSGSD